MRFCCIFPKTLLLRLPSSAAGSPQRPRQVSSVLVARFFTLSSFSGSSGLSSSAGYSSSRCFQRGQESGDVGVFIWWDFKDCKMPAGTDGHKVAWAITAAIRSIGIEGPITMTAFGDVSQLSMTNRKALSSTGIELHHVPRGGEISAKKALGMNLMAWVIGNTPPAHLFVISSDSTLACSLHGLRMKNYNILLASKRYAPGILCSAATIMWEWHSLVKGENVTGRHFNQPPDGPWYGYYRIPLQDPFAAVEQSNSVKPGESPASNSKLNSEVSIALSKTPLRFDSTHGPSTPSDQRVGENETGKSKSPGFFDRILKKFKFRGKGCNSANIGDEPRGTRELGMR